MSQYKWKAYASSVWSFVIAQWFFIALAVFIALAHSYPEFAKQGGTIKAQYSIGYGAVAVIFLISGLTMSTSDLQKNMLHFRAHFVVLTLSFLITSALIYGIVTGIETAHNSQIDEWLLVGLIVTHSCPTTVASNVIMTKNAHGNDVLTLCEVFIGNVLGAFITPALLQMYLTGRHWDFGNPTHQGLADSSIGDLYKDVMKQVGLSVFVPLFVGQVVQNIFPRQVKWCAQNLYLGKVGSVMLLLIMFQSFSTAFAQHAFTSVPAASIIFLVFFNIGIYLFFTVLSYFYARPHFIKKLFRTEPTANSSRYYRWGHWLLRPFYHNKRDTVAIMLCGPAKTAALGVSLVTSQYGSDNPNLGKLLVPLVLYQAEQVMTAQILVTFMRKWIDRDKPQDEEKCDAAGGAATSEGASGPADATSDPDATDVEPRAQLDKTESSDTSSNQYHQ
ncbi:Uncharacterized protein ABC855_g1771 [[Candida] zeylanoides]